MIIWDSREAATALVEGYLDLEALLVYVDYTTDFALPVFNHGVFGPVGLRISAVRPAGNVTQLQRAYTAV